MSTPYEGNPTGKLLIEVAWTLWTITTLILALRLYIRQRQMVLWWDDAVLVVSFVGYSQPLRCDHPDLSHLD